MGETSIIQNTAQEGGGIYNDGGTILISGKSNISENSATAYYGGDIYMEKGKVTISSEIIISKNTANKGGGIWFKESTMAIFN